MYGRRYCGIPACVNNLGNADADFPFFKRPHPSNELAQLWDQAVDTLYGIKYMKRSLCGLHFRPDDYTSKKNADTNRFTHRLKKGVLPSVPLQFVTVETDSEPIPEQEDEPEPEQIDEQEQKFEQDELEIPDEFVFNYVDVESIKHNVTEVKVEPNQVVNKQIINTYASTTNSTCQKCERFKSKVEELLKENENFQKKCEELLKENRNLKNQLFSSVCKSLNGKTKREQCDVCNEWLIEEGGHLCGDATEIQCEYCLATFKTIVDIGEHLQKSKHANMKMYKCKDCNKGFPSATLVKFHQESQYNHAVYSAMDDDVSLMEKIFKCSVCDSCFQHSIELKIHMKSHTKRTDPVDRRRITELECYICRINTTTKAEMKLHLKRHAAARTEKCVVCDERLTPKEMCEHLCYGKKAISCEYCSSSFDVTTHLMQHLETHENRMMKGCKKCPRFFAMNELIVWHEKLHENEQPRSFICDICSRGFRNKVRLRIHIECHRKEKNYLCAECGRGYISSKALVYHSKVHSTKRFKCADCPFESRTQHFLNLHRDVHSDVKYKCNQCNAVLASRGSLNSHMKAKHSSRERVKNFQCTFCSVKCENAHRLTLHMRTHTGEKPYACEICPDRRYTYKQDLSRHMQTHLGHNLLHKCDVCDERFQMYWQLKRHEFVHYKKDSDNIDAV